MLRITHVTLREVLSQAASFEGWLHLPEQRPWQLDTQGLFFHTDKDADPAEPSPPTLFDACRLVVALDAAGIEDIVFNAQAQLGSPTLDKLLEAFIFYVDHDAFLEF